MNPRAGYQTASDMCAELDAEEVQRKTSPSPSSQPFLESHKKTDVHGNFSPALLAFEQRGKGRKERSVVTNTNFFFFKY